MSTCQAIAAAVVVKWPIEVQIPNIVNYMHSTYALNGTRLNVKIYWPYIFGVFHRTGWKDWSLSTIFADIIALALVGFGLTGLLLWYLPKHKRMRRRILRR